MPGQTNNQTILATGNQEIVALNELVLTLNALKIAVQNLNFCCATTPPSAPEPGTPGGGLPSDPPGSGQTDPPGTPQEKATRRCKIAMWLIDDFLNGFVEWGDKSGADDVFNGIVDTGLSYYLPTISAIATAAVTAILTEFTTPGPGPDDLLVSLLAGGIAGYITYGIAGSHLNFAELKGFIDDNRVKMICALSNSQNAFSAHSALMAAIDDTSPSLDTGNRRLVDRLMNTAVLALLFFVDERLSILETWISEQPDTCACTETPPETGTPTNEYKCKAANYLFDNFTESFNNWASIATMTWYSTPNFISALAGGLLISLMGPLYAVAIVGWNMLAKIVSFLGTIFWSGFDYFNAFEQIALQFENNKALIICELYLAADVETAKTELENRIDDYVGNVMTAHPEWSDQADTYKDTLKALLPNDVLNVLFETTPRSEVTNYAPEDFTECVCGVEAGEWEYNNGTQWLPANYSGGVWSIPSRPTGDKWRCDVRIVSGSDCRHFTSLTLNNFADDPAANGYSAAFDCNNSQTNLPEPFDVNDLPACMSAFAFWSLTQFTVDWTDESCV